MKFKKLRAGLMAFVMALTSCVIMSVSASAAAATVVDSVTVGVWGSLNVDLTAGGVPAEGATVTITIENAVENGWNGMELFNVIVNNNWSEPAFAVTSATGTEAAGFSKTYSIADDLGGVNSFTIQNGQKECTYTVTVSEVIADNRAEYNANAYDGSPITMTKQFPDWAETGVAQGTYTLTIPGVTYGTTTVAQLKEVCKRINAGPIAFESCSADGVTAADLNYCIYYNFGVDGGEWGGSGGSVDFGQTATFSVDSIDAANDSKVIGLIGIQVNMKDINNLPESVAALKDGETFEINPAAAPAPTAYALTAAESDLYTVTFSDGENAITEAVEGTEVTATVTAAGHYFVTGVEAAGVTLTETISGTNGTETVTFTMPAAAVEVSAEVKKLETPVITSVEAGDGQVTLTWKAVENAGSYTIYWRADGEDSWDYVVVNGVSSYTVTGLTNGVEYAFYVVALNGNVDSESSNTVTTVPSAPEPAKPVVTATAGEGSVALTWDAIEGATKYYVYSVLDGVYTGHAVVTGTSYTVTGLKAGTEYGFIVRAYVDNALTAFTNDDVVYATPKAVTSRPVVTATAGEGSVDLTWTAVEGADSYYVYSRLNGTYKGHAIVKGTSYTVTGLTVGEEYGFIVRAYVDGALTPFTNADVAYATPEEIVSRPVVTATAGEGSADLTWTAVDGATGYYVYSRLNGVYKGHAIVTGTSYTVTGLTVGEEYGFIVRAMVDGALTPFVQAEVVTATPKAIVSRPAVTAAVDGTDVVLTWNAVEGASKYYVYSRLNGVYTGHAVITGTTYTVTGLTAGVEYGFIVRAYVNGALTPFVHAEVANATIPAQS